MPNFVWACSDGSQHTPFGEVEVCARRLFGTSDPSGRAGHHRSRECLDQLPFFFNPFRIAQRLIKSTVSQIIFGRYTHANELPLRWHGWVLKICAAWVLRGGIDGKGVDRFLNFLGLCFTVGHKPVEGGNHDMLSVYFEVTA